MQNLVIIITGSTRGIGLGLADYLLRRGHQLIINGRDPDRLEQTLRSLRQISPMVEGMAGDTTLEDTHRSLLSLAESKFGRVDIYINNAGIPQGHQYFVHLSCQDIEELVNVNIKGLMLGTKLSAEFMMQQGHGRIYNMEGFGSDGRIMEKLTLYGTSKRAVNYFNRSMARELAHTPVRIGSINPGMVNTDFLQLSMDKGSEGEQKRFEKVKKIMAEEVDTVVPYIAEKILKGSHGFHQIRFLRGSKLFIKIFKLMIS